MLDYLFLLAVAIPLLLLAVISPQKFLVAVFLTGGIPYTTFLPNALFFRSIGGVNPQAAYLFIVAIGLFLVLVRDLASASNHARKNSVFWLFLAFCMVSITWSQEAFEGLRFAIKLTTLAMMFLATSLYIDSDAKAWQMLVASAACGCIVLALALVNQMLGGSIGGEKVQVKWLASGILTAPYMSPANFSFLLGVNAIFLLTYYQQQKAKIALALLIVFIIAMSLAFTRIAMGGLVLGCSIILFYMSRSATFRSAAPILILGAFILLVFSYEPLQERMFFSGKEVSLQEALENPEKLGKSLNTSGRTRIWEAAFDYFRLSNKVLGSGLGSVDGWLNKRFFGTPLHSDYLRLYFDVGIIGLVLFLLAMLQIVKRNVALIHRERNRRRYRWYRVASLAGIAFFAVTLATDNSLNYVTELGIYVFGMSGIALSLGGDLQTTSRPGNSRHVVK